MLSVVTWKWKPFRGYRSSFGPEQVNTLFRMVARHYPDPFRPICVTDDAEGIDDGIEIVPLWNDFADVPSPHGGNNPSCYRRLRLFHPDAAQWFGGRYVSLDLDVVITGDLSELWNRTETFVAWGDTNPLPGSHYNGSMMLLTAGAHPEVWTDFDPETSPRKAKRSGCFGSDQGWISYRLGPGHPKWTTRDGVYSFRNHLATNMQHLPENARIVVFHGHHDPWGQFAQQIGWLRKHYC